MKTIIFIHVLIILCSCNETDNQRQLTSEEAKLQQIINYLSTDQELVKLSSRLSKKNISEVKFDVGLRDINPAIDFNELDTARICFNQQKYFTFNTQDSLSFQEYWNLKKSSYQVSLHPEWEKLSTGRNTYFTIFFNIITPDIMYSEVLYHGSRELKYDNTKPYIQYNGPSFVRLFCFDKDNMEMVYSTIIQYN